MPIEPKDSQKQEKYDWLRQAMPMFVEATGWIAFPVIGALFLGKWLDQKQGTEPLYFIGVTVLAFIVSSVGIGMTGVKYMKKIEKEEALRKKEQNESRDRS